MKTRNSHGLLQLGREALAYCQCASALISGNKALFVSVDLIGEKNQVILEYMLYTCKNAHIRGLSQKFVDIRCFRLIFNIYKYCCISTERLINADFIHTKIVKII